MVTRVRDFYWKIGPSGLLTCLSATYNRGLGIDSKERVLRLMCEAGAKQTEHGIGSSPPPDGTGFLVSCRQGKLGARSCRKTGCARKPGLPQLVRGSLEAKR